MQPIQTTSQLCLSSLPNIPLNQPNCNYQQPRPRTDNQCSTSSQNSQNEQVQIPNGHTEPLRLADRMQNGPSTSRYQPIYSVIGEGNLTGTECTICYENPIDSVLYMCGHMCMCYRCAVQQWRGKGGGQCPLCRAQIKDVIRTYKSWCVYAKICFLNPKSLYITAVSLSVALFDMGLQVEIIRK